MLQPCSAWQGGACAVYHDRPLRCRKFVCRQLQLLTQNQTTREDALEKISQAKNHLAQLLHLLEQAGDTRSQKALSTRCETLFTEPLELSPEAIQRRKKVRDLMQKLDSILIRHFRVDED